MTWSHDKVRVHLLDVLMSIPSDLCWKHKCSSKSIAGILDWPSDKIFQDNGILGKSWLDNWNPDINLSRGYH